MNEKKLFFNASIFLVMHRACTRCKFLQTCSLNSRKITSAWGARSNENYFSMISLESHRKSVCVVKMRSSCCRHIKVCVRERNKLRCGRLVVVAGVLVVDSDILEVHVINNEAVDVHDVAVQWEAHGAFVKHSIAVAWIGGGRGSVLNCNFLELMKTHQCSCCHHCSCKSSLHCGCTIECCHHCCCCRCLFHGWSCCSSCSCCSGNFSLKKWFKNFSKF